MSSFKVFTEIGLDFDNNTFGFGISSEIETGSTEIRQKGFIKMKPNDIYFRGWFLKKVLIISSKEGVKINTKQRNNFKFLIGVSGKPSKNAT